MLKRPQLAAALVVTAMVSRSAPASTVDIYAQLFPLTGEVRLLNRGVAPIQFVYYSITSAGGALNGAEEVWQSIAGFYDVSGNGLIDADHDWYVLAGDAGELTEAVFTGPGGSLPATRAISLGPIWDPFAVPFPDLIFDIQSDSGPLPVTIELALDGDYSANQVVDQADFVLWRKYVDSVTMLLADGDLNGVVDPGDYLVFERNFGTTLPLPPYGTGSGGASSLDAWPAVVPEPSGATLYLFACAWWMIAARGQRR